MPSQNCLLISLSGLTTQKTAKLSIIDPVWGESKGGWCVLLTRANYAENTSISWRSHGLFQLLVACYLCLLLIWLTTKRVMCTRTSAPGTTIRSYTARSQVTPNGESMMRPNTVSSVSIYSKVTGYPKRWVNDASKYSKFSVHIQQGHRLPQTVSQWCVQIQ